MQIIKTGRRRAAAIMVQGTASHVGKSTLAAALCRIFARHGYSVAPFKGWNMALNSYVTADGGEIGRAQGEQAEACRIEATVHMNPILIKPSSPGKSEIIVRGRVFAERGYAQNTLDETAYMLQVIGESLALLLREYEILVLEGAGSPAELNLVERDVANMKTAALAEAPVLLVGDMERGGALAACAGTVKLLPEKDRARVAGFILNKFRGDPIRLQPAVAIFPAGNDAALTEAAFAVMLSALEQLQAKYDVIVACGYGNPTDAYRFGAGFVDLGLASTVNAPVVLVADIDRGGVFASVAGTLELLPAQERDLVRGLVINRFRGNMKFLQPGLSLLTEITGKPVLGVFPYVHTLSKADSAFPGRTWREKYYRQLVALLTKYIDTGFLKKMLCGK
ncbi:MAG: cobyric acid synthase [Firmicutes bacterium]|jgi:cobyric acid synthase|nr:cobyric acid synthase [Bacillota bacterium]